MAKECLNCHAHVLKQIRGLSHHVQGTDVSGKHCYACHWEATANGRINSLYHKAESIKKNTRAKDRKVYLVIWDKGVRPASINRAALRLRFARQLLVRLWNGLKLLKFSQHCLGCHCDENNTTRPFEGDTSVPIKYAWDGQSVASRYSQKGATVWGKYSTAATNKKHQVIKSFFCPW